MTGKRGRSGRKKEPRTLLREALDRLEGDVPGLLDGLKRAAEGQVLHCEQCGTPIDGPCPSCNARVTVRIPDVDACRYLCDRILGKPSQRTEVDVAHHVQLTPAERKQLWEVGEQARQDFIDGRWGEAPDMHTTTEISDGH